MKQKFIVRCYGAGVFYCEMGRKAFCADKGIDPETASFTVEEFIRLTCNSYGSSIIRQLADRLSIKL